MGKEWDKKQDFTPIWEQCIRVMKPGALGFIMNAPRSDCQLLLLSELAAVGFNIQFSPILWAYNSGFPKAGDTSKLIDKRLGLEREVVGEYEHPGRKDRSYQTTSNVFSGDRANDKIEKPLWEEHRNTKHTRQNPYQSGKNLLGNDPTEYNTLMTTKPASPEAQRFEGSKVGHQMKPAHELVHCIQKPLNEYHNLISMTSYLIVEVTKCQHVNIVESLFSQNPTLKDYIVHQNAVEKIDEVIKARIGEVGSLCIPADIFKSIKNMKMEKQSINLNTVLLWKLILIDVLVKMNMFTIKMVSKMITDLKILNYYLVPIIRDYIPLLKNNPLNGNESNVVIVENILKNVLVKLQSLNPISVLNNVSTNTSTTDLNETAPTVESNLIPVQKNENIVHGNAITNSDVEFKSITVVMKPLDQPTYIDQVLSNGKGVTWIGGKKIYSCVDYDQIMKLKQELLKHE